MDSPPIASLPLEVLEHIFSLCIPWLHPDPTCLSSRPKHPLAFTEVSRTWRWTAFSSPRLWSVIDLANVPLAYYSLSRPGRSNFNSPFTLTTNPSNCFKISLPQVRTTWSLLTDYASRSKNSRVGISTIDVCLNPCVLFSLLSAFANPIVDFTLLTKLILRVPPTPTFSPQSISHPAEINFVAGPVLMVSIPNVRHLELEGVSVHWSSVKNLRYLCLRNLLSPELCPALDVFHSLLTRCQTTLEHCRLENIVFPALSATTTPPETTDTISFQRLHTLSISSLAITVTSILHLLSLAPSTRIQLYTTPHYDLPSLFGPQFQLGSDVTGLRLSRNSAAFFRGSMTAPIDALSISSASSFPLAQSILNSIFYSTIYPLSRLATLTLSPGVLLDVPASALTHLFNGTYGAVNLRELCVGYQCDFSMQEFLGALLPSALKTAIAGESSMLRDLDLGVVAKRGVLPCPNLRVLSFNTRWHNFGSSWLDAVLKVVVSRARYSFTESKLHRLEFLGCHEVPDTEQDVYARMSSLSGVDVDVLKRDAVGEVVVVHTI